MDSQGDIEGAWLASGMGIFFSWAFLAWLVRVWAKLRMKSWTLDDYAISGSMVRCPLALSSAYLGWRVLQVFLLVNMDHSPAVCLFACRLCVLCYSARIRQAAGYTVHI